MVGLKLKDGSDIPSDMSMKAVREAKCCELAGGGMMPNPEPVKGGMDFGEGGYWDYGEGEGGDWEESSEESWNWSEESYESGWY